MSESAGARSDEVPQEDWVEQSTEAGPSAEAALSARAAVLSPQTFEADEADLVEQEQPVDFGDEER